MDACRREEMEMLDTTLICPETGFLGGAGIIAFSLRSFSYFELKTQFPPA